MSHARRRSRPERRSRWPGTAGGLQALLQEYPDLLAQVQQTIRQRGKLRQLVAHPEWLDRMEILQEVVHTTDACVIDLQTCIHCDNRVRACETIHDDGRITPAARGHQDRPLPGGTQLSQLPRTPLCMIECPVSAIAVMSRGKSTSRPLRGLRCLRAELSLWESQPRPPDPCEERLCRSIVEQCPGSAGQMASDQGE